MSADNSDSVKLRYVAQKSTNGPRVKDRVEGTIVHVTTIEDAERMADRLNRGETADGR